MQAFGLNVSRIKNLHLIPRQISIAGKAERLSKVKNTGELGTFDFFSSLARNLRYESIVRASALAFSSHPPSQGPPSHFLIHYQARSANGFISRCRVCFCAHRGKFKSRQDLFNAVAFAGARQFAQRGPADALPARWRFFTFQRGKFQATNRRK